MNITEIHISLIKPLDGLIGFASIVLEGQLSLGSIAIHEKLDGSGHRLTFPTKSVRNRQIPIFHPITREFGKALETAILMKLKTVMSQSHAGHGRHHA